MRIALMMAAVCIACTAAPAAAQRVKGSGSTFAAALYAGWSDQLKHAPAQLDYDAVGSSAGVKQVVEHRADFGASDRPLGRATLDESGLAQFPAAVGGVVIATNVAGLPSDRLRLDGKTLADIYLGRIRTWSDPAIAQLNPGVALPATDIVPMIRSEGSGTSFVLTQYLSKVSEPFRGAVGITSNMKAAGAHVAKTNHDMVSAVHGTPGAIGYLDFSYALEIKLPTVAMKNKWGSIVAPTPAAMQDAVKAADWEKIIIDQDPTFELDLSDAGCPSCWPIATLTYVLVPLKNSNQNSSRVIGFFEQALNEGDASAIEAGYVPLPSKAKSMVRLSMRRWLQAIERTGAPGLRPQRKSDADEGGEPAGPSSLALARTISMP